jgi:hypothetical protein
MKKTSTALALKEVKANGSIVIPKQLLRKKQLSARERFYVYPQLHLAPIAMAILAISIWLTATAASAASIFWICASAFMLIVLIAWAGMDSEGNPDSYKERRERVLGDRQRRGAPHAADRRLRAKDVVYSQFSVSVRRFDDTMAVSVMEHSVPSRPYWREHKETKSARFDTTTDEWGSQVNYRKIVNNPTLASVTEAIEAVSEVAASMEERSYQERLKAVKLDRLALLYAAPRSGAEEEARVLRDEIDEGLVDLLNP